MAQDTSAPEEADVEMPRPTVAPVVLSLGITLLAAGLATDTALWLPGGLLLLLGICQWISQLIPGQGHFHEEFVPLDQRAKPISTTLGNVDHLQPGKPGYRFRLPEKVHPISAGVLGGLIGGLVMPIPALLYGILSGRGIWFPVNLLSGFIVPEIDLQKLEAFNLTALLVGIVFHVIMSITIGLLYGVLLPTLPSSTGGQLLWGGIIIPLIWTGVSYGLMGVVNPTMEEYIDWRYYFLSQLVFGLATSIVVIRTEKIAVEPRGRGPRNPSNSSMAGQA